MTYDQWKCSGADYPGDDQPEHDDEDDMQDPDSSHLKGAATSQNLDGYVQDALRVIKQANARELRLLTAAVNGRREQLERELKAELSELGNVDKAPRAPRSDKGKPRATKEAEVQP